MTKASFQFIPYLFILLLTISNGQSVSVGDFNGDGKEDFLALLDSIDDPFTLFLSEEEQFSSEELQFEILPTDPELNLIDNYAKYTIGDFNGDGYSDIIKQAHEPNDFSRDKTSASILLSDGSGGFTQHFFSETFSLNYFDVDLYVGDFNGDGKDDLVRVFTETQIFDVVLASDDAPDFFNPVNMFWYEGYVDVYPADFNGDGLDDILVRYPDGFHIHFSRGHHFSGGSDMKDYHLQSPLTVGDFNGDGKADILARKEYQYDFFLYLSNEDGPFKEVKSLWYYYYSVAVQTGDFNGDGKDDIYITGHQKNDLTMATPTIYFSNGNGFDKAGTLDVNPEHEVKISDFDGDGKDDVLEYSKVVHNELLIHLSNGDGTFREQRIRV